jgi:amidase
MAPIAHAADGGGSIRIPAACTGLVGLKPTRGLVTNGVVENEGFVSHGVVTRTVADTAAALDVLAVHDPGAWWSPPTPRVSFMAAVTTAPPAGLRVGVLAESPVAGIAVDPAYDTVVDATLHQLEAMGHDIVDVPLVLPSVEELIVRFTTIWNVAGASVPLADPERVEPHNRALRDAARSVDSWSYVDAVRATQMLSRRIVESFLASFDILVTPTMACLPPPIGAWRTGDEPLQALLNSYPMAIFTSLFNVTGQPAISLPIGHDATTNLPVGVQLVAAPWRDKLLLQIAHQLETAKPWAARRPLVVQRARASVGADR